jgi:ubiquinone/menaquinone biosynthesis C-methylase UbiE
MPTLSVEEKYADPEVVSFWRSLGKQGLQQCEGEMVARHFPRTGHLLDIGCGAGRAALALSKKGYTVTGIDLSLPMLRAGKELSTDLQVSGANLLALPFAGGTFTAALMLFGALQHIAGRSNRQRALAEMARVVQPGGHLILGLDNLAPGLICYFYWLIRKLLGRSAGPPAAPSESVATADATLWQRKTHPLLWHWRGVARTLRWRTWPGLVDLARRVFPSANGPELGDTQVAQFSQPVTPGLVYYHIYRAAELIEDAASAGWRLQGYHAGRELSEGSVYPSSIRGQDKQLFFAFQLLS